MQEAILNALKKQADFCRKNDAPLTAMLIEAAATNIAEGGVFARLVAGFAEDPAKGALALRITGAAHYLAIKGKAGALQAAYANPDAAHDANAVREALAALASTNEATFAKFIASPPQTNVIGRIAALAPGFAAIAASTDLPLDLYEPGASGGLLLAFDQFEIDYGDFVWGKGGARIASEWRGSTTLPQARINIDRRFGCDLNPIDYSDAEQCAIMHSYIWPEHRARARIFDDAISVFRKVEATVEKADALKWVREKLRARRDGAMSVFYHSVFSVYLTPEARAEMQEMFEAAGAAATQNNPLAWLRFEPEESDFGLAFNTDLTLWPGGKTRRLAQAHHHGEWVEPLEV